MKKEDLQVIKEGKTGSGLLIENDGYITATRNDILKEGMHDGEWHCPNPFIVDAVFQKAGIKNANGRIYPRNILEREIEKYQQKIQEHRALGECYTPDVMVLCKEGWKCISSVTENDEVLTLNTETNEIEIQKVDRKIEYDYNGNMIHIEGDSIDEIVTPKHRFPTYTSDKKFIEIKEAQTLSNEYFLCGTDKSNFTVTQIKSVTSIEYKGLVMCIEVPNHTFYVQSNGKSHWTCNCNHPSDSTIDLGRISHNIVELHWEGDTVVGKMELNISEGYRRSGICSTLGDTVANLLLNGYKIGVSSRAVGSVEQKLGVLMVGDDLELICWDVVSEPSTPNAWIGTKENLQQYVESNEHNQKTVISEKINKLKDILK